MNRLDQELREECILDQNNSNGFEADDFEFDDFQSVPLPNQIPVQAPIPPSIETEKTFEKPAFSFSENIVPIENNASKSRTVQTLISQNQDLMARLTVALKRNIELEQKIESQEELYHSMSSQYDILKDHSEVTQEKNKHLEFENQKLFGENSAIEKRFAELYSAYQDKVSYIQKLSYRLHRYLQYRKRIKGYIRPMITTLKAQTVDLKNQILVLNEQGIKQLDFINELKEKYNTAIDRIQAINSQNEKTQMDLTLYHETRFQGISAELDSLKIESSAIKSQNSELKKNLELLIENEATLNNKAIFFERKYTDLRNEFEQISQEFIQQKTADNSKLTTLEIQLKEISAMFAKVSEQKTQADNENRQLNDQLQSIQLIYQDNLEKIEELNRKNTAQDQINKELSQSLLESRKKSEHLEQKLLTSEEEFKRKLQAFQIRFNKMPSEPLTFAQTEPNKAGQKDLLNKIQLLLSEIQTGSGVEFKEESISTSGIQAGSELISEFGDFKE